MTKYIDKAAVMAEIQKRIDAALFRQRTLEAIGKESIVNEMVANELTKVLKFITTLEVKEVDFETVFVASIDHFDEKNNYGQWPESDLRQFAECFFELGLKAQKGE